MISRTEYLKEKVGEEGGDQISSDQILECLEKKIERHIILFFSSSLGTMGESVLSL